MTLNTLWFILITVLFIGFFFLEGFDYGVGMLLPFLGKTDEERRAIINTIGPVWDGNEVWLITAGGASFAAFPHFYATLFSGFYLALVLMLLGLILRGVSFEFRSKVESPGWRSLWDWVIFATGLLIALLWGVAVGNLMRGIPVKGDMNYYGGLLPLLNPFSILSGLVFVFLFAMHGASFLSLKTTDPIMSRAKETAMKLWLPTVVLTVLLVIWAFVGTDQFKGPAAGLAILAALIAAVALLLAGWFGKQDRFGWAFIMGSLTIVFATVMVFAGTYPNLIKSTLNPDWSLTIYNASSSPYTLKVMTIVAFLLVPIVLIYQAWTYWTFKERISPKGKLEY